MNTSTNPDSAPDTDTPIGFQVLKSHEDTEPQPFSFPWGELTTLLTSPARSVSKDKAREGLALPAWQPITASGRKDENVTSVNVLALDFDDLSSDQWETVCKNFDGLQYCYHSTRKHEPVDGKLRYRVILKLSRPVAAARWREFYQHAASDFGAATHDTKCSNPERLYYLPVKIVDGPPFESGVGQGIPLDVDMVFAYIAETAANPAPVVPAVPATATTLTRDDLQAIVNGISTKTTSPQCLDARRGLQQSIKGKSFAQLGNRDTTLFNMAVVTARQYPYATPESFGDLLLPSLHEMAGERPQGCPTRELAIQKFERAQVKVIADQQEQAVKQAAESKAKAQHGLTEGIITQPWLVQKLIERHGANLRYLREHDTWREWNGRYWAKCGDLPTACVTRTIMELIAELKADGLAELAADLEQSWTSNQVARNVLTLAQHGYPDLYASADDFDCHPDLLNTQNCTVNLRTLETYPHRREHMLTRIAAQPYDPAAECPRFEASQHAALPDSATFAAFRLIQGSGLIGTPQELCVWNYGTGSNGKTGASDAKIAVLGKQSSSGYVNMLSSDFLNPGKSSKHTSEIVRCSGARVLVINDHAGSVDSRQLRQASGQRSDIQGQSGMGENYASHKVTWSYVEVSSNDLPHLDSVVDGETRRIETTPYEQKFDKDQTFMARIIAAEGPGILRWFVDAAHEYLAAGSKWTRSEKMTELRDEAIAESDSLADFLHQECVIGEGLSVESKDLYARYSSFCKAHGVHPLGDKKFGRELKKRGHERSGTGRLSRKGIALKAQPSEQLFAVLAVLNDQGSIKELARRVVADRALYSKLKDAGLPLRTNPPPAPALATN